jgi:hypothetical protein
MLRSQRAAYVTLTLILDVTALLLAFLAAWALRDGLGGILVWLGHTFNYPVRNWVRGAQGTSLFYQILLSPNPLVGFKSHFLIFYLAAPAWLFFLNVQRAYDAQAQRNARQEFALCAYAGMLGTTAFLVLLFLIKFEVSRLLMLNFMLLGIAFLWLGRSVVLPLAQRRGRRRVRNLLVIGSPAAAQRFATILQTPAYRWSHVIGFVSDDAPDIAPDAASETSSPQVSAASPAASPASRSGRNAPPPMQHLGRLDDWALRWTCTITKSPAADSAKSASRSTRWSRWRTKCKCTNTWSRTWRVKTA